MVSTLSLSFSKLSDVLMPHVTWRFVEFIFSSFLSFPQYLADVEEHLKETISSIQPNMKIPLNEFDGKVTYGEKRRGAGQCCIVLILLSPPLLQSGLCSQKGEFQAYVPDALLSLINAVVNGYDFHVKQEQQRSYSRMYKGVSRFLSYILASGNYDFQGFPR